MKKILTAINNNVIIEKIKNEECEFINKDISYREGILEVLENNKNIDVIIINLEIPGEINFKKLIKEINKINKFIKIVLISNDEFKLKEFKEEKYLINNIDEKEINKILNKINKNIENNINNNIILENKKTEKNNNIIFFAGANEAGKTVLMLTIALNIKNKKILIINNDNSIFTYLGIKEQNRIIKFKNNIEIININNYDEKKDNKYDLIFCEIKNIENIINKKIILIINGNLRNIDKTKNLIKNKLNKYYLIINKLNKYSINEKIIKNCFDNSKIIGKINSDNIFEKYINSNFKNIKLNKKQKIKYKEIIKNIERMI